MPAVEIRDRPLHFACLRLVQENVWPRLDGPEARAAADWCLHYLKAHPHLGETQDSAGYAFRQWQKGQRGGETCP